MIRLFRRMGGALTRYLSRPGTQEVHEATCTPEALASEIRKGDVLLVEGSSRFGTAIKYLTQSTWSHAALCIREPGNGGDELIEADVIEGIRTLPLSQYWQEHTRICRPAGLSDQDLEQLVTYACSRIGHRYDLKNIFDLARYLIQTPPVPVHWRRRMLALGSGDPTRAICSSFIAQAFQSIRYPILPISAPGSTPNREILHIRHHSLFAPRDFDISPYFQIVKPSLPGEFDPHQLQWHESQ